MNTSRALPAAAIVAALSAMPASAVVSHNTMAHATSCNPTTNDLTYTTNGIRNNTTGNRSVYCGFEVREGSWMTYQELKVGVRNYANVERTVTCYATSGSPFGGGYSTATIPKPLAADGGDIHEINIYNLSRPIHTASLVIRCVLPPGTALDAIQIYPLDPSTT